MKWEYRFINPHKDGNPNAEFELNELGKEGWELVTVIDRGYAIESWIFKRHLSNQSSGQDRECESCGVAIPIKETQCGNCGATYPRR